MSLVLNEVANLASNQQEKIYQWEYEMSNY